MSIKHLTNQEIALRLARSLRAWRVDPNGAGMTQAELCRKSGVGLTPLKRFEKTGGTTLSNLVAIFRALDLLDRLEDLVPEPGSPGPLELLKTDRAKTQRQRAPRSTSTRDQKGPGQDRTRKHG
ncbi:hypothetical protein [Thiobacillus denitrificans]|uniref:hypothetical protein n=1 Tax=Thiobacillus denitrificans TaxID=36861 RepID=UPI000B270105|nr:hypothetical protein [Thiobacillus denitrificans]